MTTTLTAPRPSHPARISQLSRSDVSHTIHDVMRKKADQKERIFVNLRKAFESLEIMKLAKPVYGAYDGKVMRFNSTPTYDAYGRRTRTVQIAKLDESTEQIFEELKKINLGEAIELLLKNNRITFETYALNEKAFREMTRTDAVGAEFFCSVFMPMFEPNAPSTTVEQISNTHHYRHTYIQRIVDTTMETVLVKI